MKLALAVIAAATFAATTSALAFATVQDQSTCRTGSGRPRIDACTNVIAGSTGDANTLANAYYWRATAYRLAAAWAPAIRDYDNALAQRPNYADAMRDKGIAQIGMGQWGFGQQSLTLAIQMRPSDALALGWRGDTYAHGHVWGSALADYERAIVINPKYAAAYNGRCFARTVIGDRLDLAADDCDKALSLEPNSRSTLNARGILRLKTGDNAGAIADFTAALAFRPKDASSLYGRGLAKQHTGDATATDDIAAATALDDAIVKTYRDYGIK
jgi:tetratricopeptide (TPR) repeat protein